MAIRRPYDQVYYNLPSIPPPDHPGDDDPNAVSTLLVSGLPNDVNARELHNLFGGRPGFVYCEIRNSRRGNQVVVFVKFVNRPSAIAALHALNGLKFDPQTSSTLHIELASSSSALNIELARSNSNRRNKPGPEEAIVIDKRSTTTKEDQESSDDGDSETEESSEPDKDTTTESDDKACVDPNNTRAAETRPLSTSYHVNNLFLSSVLEKDGTNFRQWYRNLRIVLRHEKKFYVLESPVPKEPPANAAKATYDAWMKQRNDSSEVACLMLVNMVSELQEHFEHFGAYEMLHALKEMFRVQVRCECFDTLKELLGCKMAEGSSVSSHVLKMKIYVERLKTLDYPISNELATDVILNSLPESYYEFVQNFNLNNREMSIADLDMLLKIDENKKTKSSQVLGIREGRVMKPQAKAKEICKHEKAVPLKQAVTKKRPAKDDTCFHCGQVGHWLRNCLVYLEELKEKKARDQLSS